MNDIEFEEALSRFKGEGGFQGVVPEEGIDIDEVITSDLLCPVCGTESIRMVDAKHTQDNTDLSVNQSEAVVIYFQCDNSGRHYFTVSYVGSDRKVTVELVIRAF